jgi:hypothetical protein
MTKKKQSPVGTKKKASKAITPHEIRVVNVRLLLLLFFFF